MSKLAVVTGANKGIGFEVVRGLLSSQTDLRIVLCTRDYSNGEKALAGLTKDFPSASGAVSVEKLDLADSQSIASFAARLRKDYGEKIDILVHNAGFAFKRNSTVPFEKQAKPTLAVNYYGTFQLNDALLDMVKQSEDGRIITVSSLYGKMFLDPCSPAVKEKYKKMSTVAELEATIAGFIKVCEAGGEAALKSEGLPSHNYAFSKLNITKRTTLLAKEPSNENIFFASMCPGWCKTDITSDAAPKTAAEGAETIIMLALSSRDKITGDGGRSGDFWSEGKVATYL